MTEHNTVKPENTDEQKPKTPEIVPPVSDVGNEVCSPEFSEGCRPAGEDA